MLPVHIGQFLYRNIYSVGQLEVLLLLFKDPQKLWGLEDITRELRNTSEAIAGYLRDLASNQLIVQVEGSQQYRFALEDAANTQIMQSLSQYYVSHRVTMIEFIHSEKVAKLKSLADAFKVK